jgi:hypothetical protein
MILISVTKVTEGGLLWEIDSLYIGNKVAKPDQIRIKIPN